MRQTLTLALLQLRLAFRNRSALISMFAIPLLLTMIFGLLNRGADQSGNPVSLAVANQDAGLASTLLIEALQREPLLQLQIVAPDQINRLIADHKVAAALIIPAGFQQQVSSGTAPELQIVTPPGANLYVTTAPAIRRTAAHIATDYALAQKGAAAQDEGAIRRTYEQIAERRRTSGAEVTAEPVFRQAQSNTGHNPGEQGLGFIVMFVLMIILTMSGVILQERQNGTWGRLLATPTSASRLMIGYLLGFFITGMFQFVILIGANSLLFHTRWGPPLPLLAMAAATVLCGTGLGLFLASLVKTPEQQRSVGSLVVISTSMLGGVFWPLDVVSDTMRRIGYLTPQAWAMDGFREVMLRGGSWSALTLPLAVLVGLTALFVGAGLIRFQLTNR